MLYYQVEYNVSATCFGHYLAMTRLYFTCRVTVLCNQCVCNGGRDLVCNGQNTWTQLIGSYQYLLSIYYILICLWYCDVYTLMKLVVPPGRCVSEGKSGGHRWACLSSHTTLPCFIFRGPQLRRSLAVRILHVWKVCIITLTLVGLWFFITLTVLTLTSVGTQVCGFSRCFHNQFWHHLMFAC